MKIFLDTANIDDIRHAARLGLISGVTTNPSLMAQEEGISFETALNEICSIVDGPISAEVLNIETADAIATEARNISSIAPNIVVKVPITEAGLEATSILSKENINTNLTLCFSTNQALLSAVAGATYVSPFVGRLDDIGHDGMQLVAEIVEIYQRYNFPTQVIAASIRHPLHCIVAARVGAHIATVPYKVLMQMMHHPLTDIGIARFAEAVKLAIPGVPFHTLFPLYRITTF